MRKYWPEFRKYLFEVLAIITAITLSFWFDEWREKRRDRRDSIELLSSIADNLKADTALLRVTRDLQKQMLAGEAHILKKGDSAQADSIMLGLIAFQTYPTFRKTDVAYLTMVQSGQSRVIANKKLLNQINNLYQAQYRAIDEWTEIERRTVLEKNIPYITANSPFVRGFEYASLMQPGSQARNAKFKAMLSTDEFKNLLNVDYAFKKAMNMFYESTHKSIDTLLRNVDAEVRKMRN